jgi:hypothetical protein
MVLASLVLSSMLLAADLRGEHMAGREMGMSGQARADPFTFTKDHEPGLTASGDGRIDLDNWSTVDR